MFKTQWSFGRENFSRVRDVRKACFIEERGVAEAEEFDEFDGISAHLLVEAESGEPIAAGRIFPFDGNTRIGRICVMPQFQNQPFFDLVLRVLLYKAEGLAGEHIVTHAAKEEEAVYLPFGFCREGEPFFERNAERVRLSVPRGSVLWPSHCKHQE